MIYKLSNNLAGTVVSDFLRNVAKNCALLGHYSLSNNPGERSSYKQWFSRQQKGTLNSRAVRDLLYNTNSYTTLDPVYLAPKYTQLWLRKGITDRKNRNDAISG
jgi:hypothetical protein